MLNSQGDPGGHFAFLSGALCLPSPLFDPAVTLGSGLVHFENPPAVPWVVFRFGSAPLLCCGVSGGGLVSRPEGFFVTWRTKPIADKNPKRSSGSHHKAARTFKRTFSFLPRTAITPGPAKLNKAKPSPTSMVFHHGASTATLIILPQMKFHSVISSNRIHDNAP